jgi:hypothetical protein
MFSIGLGDSAIPPAWAAGADSPGVDLLPDLSEATADAVLDRVRRVKRAGDVVVTSIHWGSNWRDDIPAAQIAFAHRLLDGEVDLIHGHSSHHPRPIEVYRDKLVLYGCGDFINDYEGIGRHEEYRDDAGRLLGRLQQRSFNRCGNVDRDEAIRREQVSLAALVNDSEIAVLLGVLIRKNDEDLIALERGLVAAVVPTNTKPPGSRSSLASIETMQRGFRNTVMISSYPPVVTAADCRHAQRPCGARGRSADHPTAN